MNAQYTPPQTERNAEPLGTSQVLLEGIVLLFARGIWLASLVAVLIIFVVSIPAYVAYLHTIRTSGIDLYAGQLTHDGLHSLQALGLPLDGYAAYLVGVKILFVSVWLTVSVVIFWRKSDDRMALFASFTLMTFSIGFGYWVAAVLPNWQVLLLGINFLSGVSLGICLYIFPDGQFVPRWSRWPLVIGCVYHQCNSTFPAGPLNSTPLLSWFDSFLFPCLLGSIVAVQVYRYRCISTAVQRQQTKWAVFGFVVAVVGFFGTTSIGMLFLSSLVPGTLFFLVQGTVLYCFLLFIPLFIGIAVLRSHLWDIDIIIKRTLVYGILSVSLGLIYAGLIIGLQFLLQGVIGQDNPLVIVASTLTIAALFQPLKHRIQLLIDRRFYRHKYDAARTLETFSATLQNEVELGLLSEQLLAVVKETMQPTKVSLWLRPSRWRMQDQPHRLEAQSAEPPSTVIEIGSHG